MVRSSISIGIAVAVALPAAAKPPRRSATADVPADVPASVYAERRARLMQQLGDCVGAIRSYAPDGEDGNAFDNWFFYLTGIRESGAVLILAPREPIYRQQLLLRPRDAEAEIWVGYREPLSPALERKYRVDYVGRNRGGVPRHMRNAFRRSRCYAELRPTYLDQPAFSRDALGKYLTAFEVVTRQRWKALEAMRAVHDAAEIARMDRAVAITIEGHRAAVRRIAAGVSERRVAAALEKAFYDAGATGLAFPSIVAAGEHGAVLHWGASDSAIGAGDLVVVDIGASYGGYAADVTRTWPVSGRFTAEQRRMYELVLAVQQKVIDAVRPGVSLDELHEVADRALADAGYPLPHGIGHFVGLDVHDVGDTSGPLEPGMVITVEPGIYLQGQFGVRIEDMVLVTPRGHRVMTEALPRSVADVEGWMAAQRR